MISHLMGVLDRKTTNSVIVDVAGVGYEVFVPQTSALMLSVKNGSEIKLYIVESVAMYGGSVALYGFSSQQERDVFLLLKEEVPGAGAKKALEYFDKVSKSISSFVKAVSNNDVGAMSVEFGFTKKTAEKIIAALKDKIQNLSLSYAGQTLPGFDNNIHAQAIAGLVALGYRQSQAKEAVSHVFDSSGKAISVEDVIRKALRYL